MLEGTWGGGWHGAKVATWHGAGVRGLMNMGMGLRAYGGCTQAWWAYEHMHMVAWLYRVGLTKDVKSYAQV